VKPDFESFISYNLEWFNFPSFFDNRLKYPEFRQDYSEISNFLNFLIRHNKFTLREIEQLFAKMNLVKLATKENIFIYPGLLVYLLIIKERYPEVYWNYIDESSNSEKSIKCLHSMVPESVLNKSYECAMIEAMLIAAKNKIEENDEVIKRHEDIIQNENSSDEVKEYSQRVLRIWKDSSISRKV
jgi:hypothetical protein